VFPHIIESIVADETNATITAYRHGLKAGDKVRLTTEAGGTDIDLDSATVLSDGLTRDVFKVACTITQGDATAVSRASVRPVRVAQHRTCGGESVFVDWRPLVDVVSLSVPDGQGGWTAKLATEYEISGDTGDGVSLTGEIVLLYDSFSRGTGTNKHRANGVRIEYVSGESFLVPTAKYVFTKCLGTISDRLLQSGIQSESMEYYSYTRSAADGAGVLIGEFDGLLNQLRIPC